MIVEDEGDELRFVTQPDHAHFAGALLALFRIEELVEHPRRHALLHAVREHDNGWRESDSSPRIDPGTGRPHTFRTLPGADRIEIWRRGCNRYLDIRPETALLVVRHALALVGPPDELDPELTDELRELDETLRESLGRAEEEVRSDYRWLALADALSLAVCGGTPPEGGTGEWRWGLRRAARPRAPSRRRHHLRAPGPTPPESPLRRRPGPRGEPRPGDVEDRRGPSRRGLIGGPGHRNHACHVIGETGHVGPPPRHVITGNRHAMAGRSGPPQSSSSSISTSRVSPGSTSTSSAADS